MCVIACARMPRRYTGAGCISPSLSVACSDSLIVLAVPTRYSGGALSTNSEVEDISSSLVPPRKPDLSRRNELRRSLDGSGVDALDLRSKRIGGAGTRAAGCARPCSGTDGLKRSCCTTIGLRVNEACSVTNCALRKYSLHIVLSFHHSEGGSGWPLSCSNTVSDLNGALFCSFAAFGTASGNRNSKGYSTREGGQVALGVALLDNVCSWQNSSTSETC